MYLLECARLNSVFFYIAWASWHRKTEEGEGFAMEDFPKLMYTAAFLIVRVGCLAKS